MDGISFQIGGAVLGGGVVAVLLAVADRIRGGAGRRLKPGDEHELVMTAQNCKEWRARNESEHAFFFENIHRLKERSAASEVRDAGVQVQLDRIERKLDGMKRDG